MNIERPTSNFQLPTSKIVRFRQPRGCQDFNISRFHVFFSILVCLQRIFLCRTIQDLKILLALPADFGNSGSWDLRMARQEAKISRCFLDQRTTISLWPFSGSGMILRPSVGSRLTVPRAWVGQGTKVPAFLRFFPWVARTPRARFQHFSIFLDCLDFSWRPESFEAFSFWCIGNPRASRARQNPLVNDSRRVAGRPRPGFQGAGLRGDYGSGLSGRLARSRVADCFKIQYFLLISRRCCRYKRVKAAAARVEWPAV